MCFFFFSSRRRHTRWNCDWSSDVCSSDLFARLRRGREGGDLLRGELLRASRDADLGVDERQEERERAALAGGRDELDLAAEHARDLPADREPEAGAAVLAAGRAVRLLERLEDDLLLVGLDADARVADGERDGAPGAREALVLRAPAGVDGLDLERHPPALGELEGVGEQVLDDLLEPLDVGVDGERQRAREVEDEVELLLLG